VCPVRHRRNVHRGRVCELLGQHLPVGLLHWNDVHDGFDGSMRHPGRRLHHVRHYGGRMHVGQLHVWRRRSVRHGPALRLGRVPVRCDVMPERMLRGQCLSDVRDEHVRHGRRRLRRLHDGRNRGWMRRGRMHVWWRRGMHWGPVVHGRRVLLTFVDRFVQGS